MDFKANKAMFFLTFFNIGYIWDIMGFYGECFRIMRIVHIDNTITLGVLRIQCIESMVFLLMHIVTCKTLSVLSYKPLQILSNLLSF